MNKKKMLVGSAVVLLAGVGIYVFIKSQKETEPAPADAAGDQPWTTADIPDLTGKVIIVTGANSGIGFEAAKEFARKGAQTILACRNMEKAQAALAQIQAEIPDAKASVMHLDLANLASVHQFAETFKAKYDRLDVLLNNAGIMMAPYGTTEDGFEQQVGINHLGHFALTGLLIDRLLATPGARVVNVSSTAHRFGTLDFDNLLYEEGKGYTPLGAYGRSKLANLLFTYELQRRFEAASADAIAVAAHPGTSDTNLARYLEEHWAFDLFRPLMPHLSQSAAMGALPSLRAAVDPDVQGGQYFGPDGFMEVKGYPLVVQPSDAAYNEADARKLWDVSEQLTGVPFARLDKSL
jgi:NAD(P)-dependent dehydrogenase (short-subunit alcohol dehydrogenase family)